MRAPKKVIAAMALATLIGGAVTPAFADDFTTSSGDNGQSPLKTYSKKVEKDTNPASSSMGGDIIVNGKFIRTVTNFPVPTEDGHYLQVTMPIQLDYTYNLDTNKMTSAKGMVINESTYFEKAKDGGDDKIEGKAVNMSFVKLDAINNEDDMVYVKNVDNINQKVQLPFQVVITKDGENVGQVPLASIQEDKQDENTFEVKSKANLQLEIKQIGDQKVVDNANVLKGKTTSIGHKMTMKFEYLG